MGKWGNAAPAMYTEGVVGSGKAIFHVPHDETSVDFPTIGRSGVIGRISDAVGSNFEAKASNVDYTTFNHPHSFVITIEKVGSSSSSENYPPFMSFDADMLVGSVLVILQNSSTSYTELLAANSSNQSSHKFALDSATTYNGIDKRYKVVSAKVSP